MSNEKRDSEILDHYKKLEKRRKLLKASAAVPLIATLNPNAMAASASAIGACAERLEDINPAQKTCGKNKFCGENDTWISTTSTGLPKTYSVVQVGYPKIAISTISQQKAAARGALRGDSGVNKIAYRCDYTRKVYKVGNKWYYDKGWTYKIEDADGIKTPATDDDVCSKGEFVDAILIFEKYSNGERGVAPQVRGIWPKTQKNTNTQGMTKSCYATFPNTNNSVISS